MPADAVLRSEALDRRVLEYLIQVVGQSDDWWRATVPGTLTSRTQQFDQFRARYAGRRSVGSLAADR